MNDNRTKQVRMDAVPKAKLMADFEGESGSIQPLMATTVEWQLCAIMFFLAQALIFNQ